MHKIHETWYNTVMDLGDMSPLPGRRKFIDRELDKPIKDIFEKAKYNKSEKELMFLPASTHEMSLWKPNSTDKQGFYTLIMFGIAESGRRMTVAIEGIRPYFVVRLPKDKKDQPETFREELTSKLSAGKETRPLATKVHMAKRYIGYEENEYPYIWLEFPSLKKRSAAFRMIRNELGYETGWDDTNSYHRVVSRDYNISLTQWLVLKDFKVEDNPNFKDDIITVTIDQISNYNGKLNRPSLLKEKTLIAYWDIETYARDHSIPRWNDKNAQMFQISLIFCWLHDNEPAMQYMITTKPSKPRPGYATILCKDEGEMILAMGKLLELMTPEFWVAFNCGNYDFPWIIERAKKAGVFTDFHDLCSAIYPYKESTQDEVAKWSCYSENVKIEADTMAMETTFRVPGTLSFDLCNMFRQLFPNDGYWSLDYFLAKCKLPPKNEVKPQQIFAAFEAIEKVQRHPLYKQMLKYEKPLRPKGETYSNRVLLEQYEDDDETDVHHEELTVEELYKRYNDARDVMTQVAEYCIVDSFRCHQLLKLRDIITSKRMMAHISNTSMYDAIYRAGGCKSRNRIIGKAKERNLVASNAKKNSKTDLKYPGAYVFNPKPGFRITRLTPNERRSKYRDFIKDREEHPTRYENCIAQERQNPPYEKWKDVTDEQIKLLEDFIYEHDIDCVKMTKPAALSLVRNAFGDSTCKPSRDQEEAIIEYLMEDTDYPVTGLDFASLYPSVDMTYNLSGEMIISPDDYTSLKEAREVAARLKQKGYNLHRIEFPYGNTTVLAWCIRHDNDPKKMGVFPSVYVDLFALRERYKAPVKLYDFMKEYCAHYKKKSVTLFELLLVLRLRFPKKDKSFVEPRVHLETLELFPNEEEIASIEERITRFKTNNVKAFLGLDETAIDYVQPNIETLHNETVLTLEDINFYYNHFDTKQLQVKVYMNTFYGESGNQISPLYKKEIAGGITTGGVHSIKFAAGVVREEKCGIVYGDSVASYTPILCRLNNKMFYECIASLPIDGEWIKRGDKEEAKPVEGLEVWSDKGFTKIIRIIRHMTTKQMFRIGTKTGFVTVTKDHSLLHSNGTEIAPTEVTYRMSLMHKDIPMLPETDTRVPMSYINGVFLLNGYVTDKVWGIKYLREKQVQAISATLRENFPDDKFFTTDDTIISKTMVSHWEDHFPKSYVPDKIMNADRRTKLEFLTGAMAVSHYRSRYLHGIKCRSELVTAQIYHIAISVGYYPTMKITQDDPGTHRIMLRHIGDFSSERYNMVTFIQPITGSGGRMVYDLETANHHFAAGAGRMVVHNTDSLYIYANPALFREVNKMYFSGRSSKLEYWTKLVTMTAMEIGRVQTLVNKRLAEDNGSMYLKMAYEEVLWEYFLSRKKKYGGIPHKEIPNFDITSLKKLFLRGLDVRKRGTSVLTIRATENILLTAIKPTNTLTWRELTLNEIDRIYEEFNAGRLGIDQFIKSAKYKPISAIMRAEGKGNKSVLSFADRMKARGTPLTPHTRFNFVIALGQQYKYDYRGRKRDLSTGERMETVEFVTENRISVDINYYMLNYICGQLAQFVSYHPDFYQEPKNDSHDETKRAADATNNAAKKFLIAHCKRYATKHVNRGPLVRLIFKYVKEQFEDIFAQLGHSDWSKLMFIDWQVGTTAKFRKSFVELVEKNAIADLVAEDPDNYVRKKLKRHGKDFIYVMYRDYVTSKTSKQKQAKLRYNEKREKYIGLLAAKINTIMSTIHKNIDLVEKANMAIRKLGKFPDYFSSATKPNPSAKDLETLLSRWMDEEEMERVLDEFRVELKRQLKEFADDEYYQRGVETLQLVYDKLIRANQQLTVVEEIAKIVTRRVKKLSGQHDVDEEEMQNMAAHIMAMSDQESSSGDEAKTRKLKKGSDEKKLIVDQPDEDSGDDDSIYDSDGDNGVLVLDDINEEEMALPIEDD